MKEIYKNKALCVCNGCEVAENCLRNIAFREVDEKDKQFMIVNPMLTSGNADCEYYAHEAVIRYARGFKKVLGLIPVDKANAIYHQLMCHFGKNQYYDRRNGKLLLSPEEQEYIREVFAKYEITTEVFDAYEDKESWVDGK